MRRVWLGVVCGALIVCISMGVRQAFGLFVRPISVDLGLGREALSLAIAIQNLCFGLVLPFIGALADRFGLWRTISVGSLLYATGLLLTTSARDPLGFALSSGLLIGLALGGTTFVLVFGALGRVVPLARRTMAFGIVTAGGSFGMFAFVPGAQALLSTLGWRAAFGVLALGVAAITLLALGLPRPPTETGAAAAGGPSLREALLRARSHAGYWLINAGFFVCGFHVAFVGTHLPAYLNDNGLASMVAANALAMIGLFNIAGSYVFGMIGDVYRKKYVLSIIYAARAVAFVVFLALPPSNFSAILFGAMIGFLWLGTVPLTSGLVAQVFGVRHLATLYGIVFLSHQIGAFIGVWLGGIVYDRTGSYNPVWFASVALSLLAALIHLPIVDQPVSRLQQAA